MRKANRDLTTGSVYGNILYMSLPTMFGFFAQTLFSIVDMIYIGMISPEAIAGVTIYGTIFAITFIFNDVIGTSSISLISQNYGRKDYNKTSKIIEQTIIFKGIVALCAGLLMVLMLEPLIDFFTDDPLVKSAALEYGYIRSFFLPIMFSSYTVNTAMRCIGDSKNPLYIMVITAVLNIILDPIFMFESINLGFITIPGLGLGVFGAALATVISSSIAFLIAFWILLSNRTHISINPKGLLKLDWSIDYKLMTIGLPNGLEGLNRNIANFLLLKLITQFDTTTLAAYGIVLRLMEMCFMPLFGLNMGGSTIIGQNLGANNITRIRKSIRASISLGVFIMASLSTIIFLIGDKTLFLFTDDILVAEEGFYMLKFLLPSMIIVSSMFGLGTAFSGSGYNKPFLISSIISRWLVLLPISYLSYYVLGVGITGILIAFVLSEISSLMTIFLFYKKGDWINKKV